jgi:hypothetical protein
MAMAEAANPAVIEAIRWQAEHAIRGGAPITARIVLAELALLDGDTAVGRRIRSWPGETLNDVIEDAMPLRLAGGLHYLQLTGEVPELAPVYLGDETDQSRVDAIVVALVEKFDAQLSPWLDGPPQTNEAGRSASFVAGLLWLSQVLGPRFEMDEIGASAGVNCMIERYFYDLGGVQVGTPDSPMRIVPEWRGPPPPRANVEIVSIRGCDIAPVDLTDPAQALRLKAYVWADAKERMARIDAAIALAAQGTPDLEAQDAGAFVLAMLARPQPEGAARVLYHSIMWQYMSDATRDAITSAMDEAGARATSDRPLVHMKLETNRATFAHELMVKYWPNGDRVGSDEWKLLAQAHPHGAWVEWFST